MHSIYSLFAIELATAEGIERRAVWVEDSPDEEDLALAVPPLAPGIGEATAWDGFRTTGVGRGALRRTRSYQRPPLPFSVPLPG